MFLPDVPGFIFDVLQTQKLRDLHWRQSVSDIHLVSKEENGNPPVLNVWRQRWEIMLIKWQIMCRRKRIRKGRSGKAKSLTLSIFGCYTKIKCNKETGQKKHRPGWFSNVSSSSLATTILSLSALSMTNMIACPSLKNNNGSQNTELSHKPNKIDHTLTCSNVPTGSCTGLDQTCQRLWKKDCKDEKKMYTWYVHISEQCVDLFLALIVNIG